MHTASRRGGRAAEGAPLLREYTLTGIVGSNPILSATDFPVTETVRIARYFSQEFRSFRYLISTETEFPQPIYRQNV